MDEREVMLAWRTIFRGNDISSEALKNAQFLLDGLTGESPLHLRLATELEELKKLSTQPPSKGTRKCKQRS